VLSRRRSRGPVDDRDLAGEILGEARAALDPVAVVVIGDAADLADLGAVDVAADDAVEPAMQRLVGATASS
jgi:hypothetical protein